MIALPALVDINLKGMYFIRKPGDDWSVTGE